MKKKNTVQKRKYSLKKNVIYIIDVIELIGYV